MTFGRLALAVIMTMVIGGRPLPAQTIAAWQMLVAFPTGTGNVPTGNTYLPPNTPNPAGTPSSGNLVGDSSAILSTFHTLAAATYTSPAGNGSTYSFSSNNWSPGDYYQVVLPTTGYENLSVSWDQARSSTGPAAFALQMSTDGTTFTPLTNYTVLQSGGGGAPGTWSSTTYNALYTSTFALPVAADNQASLYLRFTNVEAAVSAATGSNRIDNIAVTVVPEPSAIALVGLGLGGMFLRRRQAG